MIVDCPSAYVVDGDTLRCGSERVRLLGIDAPEIHGCPRWRSCAPGDGQESRQSLLAALRMGRVRFEPVTVDRYGRQVAVVWAGRKSLLLAAQARAGHLQAALGQRKAHRPSLPVSLIATGAGSGIDPGKQQQSGAELLPEWFRKRRGGRC